MGNILIVKTMPCSRKANFDQAIRVIERGIKHGTLAFFFDYDRVIADTTMQNRMIIKEALDSEGLEPDRGVREHFDAICSGPGPRWVLTTLVPRLREEPERLGEIIKRLPEIAPKYEKLVERTPITCILPDIKRYGRRSSIMTNRNKHGIFPSIDRLGIRKLLEFVFYASSIMPEKPGEKMFQEGIRWTGVRKNEALFLDDNPVCVQAAMKAGLPSFHVEWNDIPRELLIRKQ